MHSEPSLEACIEVLTVEKLAEVLNEPNLLLLRRVLACIGTEHAARLVVETLHCEAGEGLRTRDGTRRRTKGGTFFALVRQQVSRKNRKRLFPFGSSPNPDIQPPPPRMTWAEGIAIGETLATAQAGEARTMKLTLIGRPGHVEVRHTAVVFRLQGPPPGTLPKGLPVPPEQAPLTWTVLLARRQWERVKDSLARHPEDKLVIEGYPVLQGTQHMLLAQSCLSVMQSRARQQAQRQASLTAPA